MKIGRKIYYDKATGNVLIDTGERAGSVVETTQEQDFAVYAVLAERVPDTVGVIQLGYQELGADFAASNGYHVDVSGATPALVFSYPDPTAPADPPVYRPALSTELDNFKADYASRISQLQDDQNYMLEQMIAAGIA